VCRDGLDTGGDRVWSCPRSHAFDVAREGYANLLITHQRRRREPGDSAGMLQHRRAFLDAGHYAPLADALRRRAAPGLSVLDAGCGEGHYTRSWPDDHDDLHLAAVDIARPAVRLAARRQRHPRARYAVASVYDLPIADASVDVALSVFAPLHSPELERVVRPGGRVLTVTPGPAHLAGLTARLFATPEPHPDTGPFERDGAATVLRADPDGHERIRFDLELGSPDAVRDLLGMTPYAWYVSPAAREAVVAGGSLSTPVDFLLSSYLRP
jgi:23S rRNA (guanine745-N1)-methyltransferase